MSCIARDTLTLRIGRDRQDVPVCEVTSVEFLYTMYALAINAYRSKVTCYLCGSSVAAQAAESGLTQLP